MKYIFHGKGCHFTYRYTLDLIREVWQAYPGTVPLVLLKSAILQTVLSSPST